MASSRVKASFLTKLVGVVGEAAVSASAAVCEVYAWDNTDLRYPPEAVVMATTTEQVMAIMQLCHQEQVAVVPRGAGTGNVGGALAVEGGIVLTLQQMNRILEIHAADKWVRVQPGVVNADLQAYLKPHHLMWPPDPSSAKSCTIGGNIAMCSAGPRAVRYGVTRDWVLGLTAVLADGTRIQTGGKTTKGVVGFDLTRLLIGSEGMLAVVTEAILKLAPLPEASRLLRVVFTDVQEATEAVAGLLALSDPPCAIEFLDRATLQLLQQSGAVAIPKGSAAMLLLEVCGAAAEVDQRAMVVENVLRCLSPLEIVRAKDSFETQAIWEARFAISPALRRLAPKRINEDVVVPVSRLPDLIASLEAIAQAMNIPIVSFGHAGNGNLHVNLLVDPEDPLLRERIYPTLEQIFVQVLALGGTLSGEHGVGLQKKSFIALELDPATLQLQKRLKNLFDPHHILNPGKVFP